MKQISCLCLTYGNVTLLEEALYSFLQLKYDGDYELVILNDFPKQKLFFEHPKVRIINLDHTLRFWGLKEDYGIWRCKYDTIMQFDNDDIAFPNLLNKINEYFTDDAALLHWNNALFWMGHRIAAIKGVGNSGIVFSKKAVEKMGTYPHENTGADMRFVNKIAKMGMKIVRAKPNNDEVVWNYRWSMYNYNASGLGDDRNRPEEQQIISRHTAWMEKRVEQGLEPIGDIELKPHWDKDYFQIYQDYLAQHG